MVGSRFKIEPDPPQAGRVVHVTYVGPADEVEWQVDGQAPNKVKPDANGEFTFTCPHGKALTLSDNIDLYGYLHREIVDTSKK